MAAMSVSGIVSGMDWESMIDEIITNAAKPAQPQVSKKTNLTNKKSLFEEMKTTMNSLQSSLSPLKLPSTYKAKTIDIERLDKNSSYKGVLTATVNADAEVNVWDVTVKQLASAQINRSKQITGSSLSSTLSGVSGNTMYVNAGGQKIGIEVKSTDTLESLKSRINTTLKTLESPIYVTASVVDNKLILKSDYTGLGTMTATETTRYNYSSGVNKLNNISIPEAAYDNVKITSGTKSYVIHKDFEVANGNEIRWKQYDRGDKDHLEVGLDGEAKINYKMAAGDVYTNKGTYNTDDVEIGFDIINNGTLASRAKIVDDEGKTYVYGKDFTITNNKVVWLEEEKATTNEPDSYTVNYSKTETATYSTGNIDKGVTDIKYTDEPDSYIVRYGDRESGSYDVNFTRGPTTTARDSISINYTALNDIYSKSTNSDIAFAQSTRSDTEFNYYLNPADRSEFLMTASNGAQYEYGVDYVIGTTSTDPSSASATWQIIWGKTNGGSQTSSVVDYQGATGVSGTSKPLPSSGTQFTFGVGYELDNNRMGRVNASDNDKLLTTVFGSDFDMSTFDSTKLTIRGYTYGTDFTVETDETSPNYGEIQWIEKTSTTPSRDDVLTDVQFTSLQNAYNTANGTSAIPTVTLTDADGVLRTYLDPADASAFTMKSGSTTYEYGKDYVIRVNDDRTGYVVSWAITEDANDDGTTDINDANTAVTTYTQYKKLTTYGMKASPSTTASYALAFSGNYTTEASGSVNKTDTDKSLATVLKSVTVDAADYASTLTITDGTKTYAYGTDWTIDEAGNITWIESNTGRPSAYNVSFTKPVASFDVSASGGASPQIGGRHTSSGVWVDWGLGAFFNATETTDTDPSTTLESVYHANEGTLPVIEGSRVASSNHFKFFTDGSNFHVYVTDASGNVTEPYTYGDDFVIRSSMYNSSTEGPVVTNLSWVASDGNTQGFYPYYDATATHDGPPSGAYTVAYTHTYSASGNETATLTALLGTSVAESDYSDVVLTSTDGTKTYKYSADGTDDTADYTITDGKIVWLHDESPKHPTGAYTFYYDAFAVSTDGTDTYSSANTSQEVSIAISDGAGKIGGDKVSYEQILDFADIAPTSSTPQDKIDDSLGKFFTLSASDGKSYIYGTDYRVVQGDADSDTGEHTTKIEWLSGTGIITPADGTGFKLAFTGGETISTTLKRSATDAAFSPSVTLDDLDGGTVTITQGMKTFYKGVDFNLADDADGNAVIEWISDDKGGYEWFYPEAGTSYTVNITDSNGNSTSYTGRKNSSDTLDMADLGMTTANGSISLKYGDGLSYKLDAPTQYETDDDGNYKLDENGDRIPVADTDGHAAIRSAYSTDITKSGTEFNFRWLTPPLTSHSDLPSMNDEITVEYEYDANTFDLEDDSDGDLLYALGFVKSDKTTYDDYTAAKNAILDVDGEEVERDSNDIGADYENELIKGVTMHLKGLGEVSLDISHDAEKAVTSIQSFVDSYNDLMSWMNTRMSEKQVDEDTKATIDSDDFRMRWGLLHGNSLLRNTKSQMRSLTSQNFTFSFTQRKSSEEVYGPMSFNGLRTSSTLRLRIGTKYVDVTIDPTDTLETIVKKISDDTKGGAMNDIYYDDNGEKLKTPLLKAVVENDRLVIQSSSNDEITMSGSAAMNALKMNYTYKGLYQIGIESTSDDYGKSGELVFDESEFMEALEDNPDEVQALMLKFVGNFDTWIKSMLSSSSSGETSGTLTREIENIQSQIDNINEYLENYQERLDRMEESLRTRYANTETQFSKLSQQANSIAAILNQLNGTASGGGYGQTSS